MTKRASKSSMSEQLLTAPTVRVVDTHISFTGEVNYQSVLELYEFLEAMEYTHEPLVLRFHIAAHARLNLPSTECVLDTATVTDFHGGDHYVPTGVNYPASLKELTCSDPGAVGYLAYQFGAILADEQSGYRLKDHTVDNSGERYHVLFTLRPLLLKDLVSG